MSEHDSPSERWHLVDFQPSARSLSLLVPLRWRGDAETRPTLLPFKPGKRELPTFVGAELDALVERLVQSNVPRLHGVWSDAKDVEIDGHEGDVVITWRAGQPSVKDVALLRRLHAPFAETSLTALRATMAGAPVFAFQVDFHNTQQEARFVAQLREAGLDATVVGNGAWEMAWPPACIAVERFAEMWSRPYRYALVENEDGSRAGIVQGDAFVVIDEGKDLVDELVRRMREAGVPTVPAPWAVAREREPSG